MIDSEVGRVRTHLDDALASLATRDLRGLDRAARLARGLLVGALEQYRDAGVFPRNLDHPAARPAFVDAAGTRCAMAHLMELGGASDLVAEVARTANHAQVVELAADPRLVAWLDAAGLTVAEAARIQPGYCMAPGQALCRVAPATQGAPAAAVIEATILEPPLVRDDYGGRVALARLDVIHGTSLYEVGETVDVWPFAVAVTTGDRVLLVVEAGDPRTVKPMILVRLEHDDVAGATGNTIFGDLGPVEVGRLTKEDILALRDGTTRDACYQGLLARDPCYADCLATRNARPDRCVYGATIADAGADGSADAGVTVLDAERAGERPEGDASARAGSDRPIETAPAGAAPGAPATFPIAGGSACAVSGGGSSAASVAVLLAVAGALVVRHRSRS